MFSLNRLMLFFLIIFSFSMIFSISEENFSEIYNNEVIPFFNSGEFGEFQGVDNITICYWKHVNPIADEAVVILTGYTESFVKYAELAYDISQEGYSVYMMDHRGMGTSERLISDDHFPVYVKGYEDYVADAKIFFDTVVSPDAHFNNFLIAHSMGGGVSAHYLMNHPDDFTAAVLSAPMMQVDTGKYPEWFAYFVTNLATVFGQGKKYALGEGQREPGEFADNSVTSSYSRWHVWNEIIIPENPGIESGGATNRWVRESLKLTWDAQKNADEIETPFILFQAENEAVVKNDGQDKVCNKAYDCNKLIMFDAKHEILMERDEIRDEALENIFDFLGNF
ncbi:MAG: alpha/beta fold hydrolase [bacterium]